MTLQNSVHLYWCSCNQKGLEYSQVLYLAPGSEHVQLWLRFKDLKSFLLGFSKILTAGVSEMISKEHLLQDGHRFVWRTKGKLAGFLIVLLQLQSNCFHYSVSLSTKGIVWRLIPRSAHISRTPPETFFRNYCDTLRTWWIW